MRTHKVNVKTKKGKEEPRGSGGACRKSPHCCGLSCSEGKIHKRCNGLGAIYVLSNRQTETQKVGILGERSLSIVREKELRQSTKVWRRETGHNEEQ